MWRLWRLDDKQPAVWRPESEAAKRWAYTVHNCTVASDCHSVKQGGHNQGNISSSTCHLIISLRALSDLLSVRVPANNPGREGRGEERRDERRL